VFVVALFSFHIQWMDKPHMTFHLSMPRLLLRPFHQGDAISLKHLVMASRTSLLPWLDWAHDFSTIDGERFVVHGQRAWRQSTPRRLPLAILARHSMALVGVIDVHDCCWLRAAGSLGVWLAESARGHGYATQACQLMIGLATNWWHFKQLHWVHTVGNHASARLARRLGFELIDINTQVAGKGGVVYMKELPRGLSCQPMVYAIGNRTGFLPVSQVD
jgi:RimJ/RimL family protein N-acetyltransferase